MKKIIFISPPKLTNNGKNLNVDSDIYHHFVKGMSEANIDHEIVKFITDENSNFFLDTNHLLSLVEKNKNSIILVDGNFNPGDSNGLYPVEVLNLLKQSKLKVVCFVPDLIKEVKLSKWIEVSNFLIATTKPGVEWANNFYKTNKFVYYPTFPVSMYGENDIKNFLARPYDIGYIGSNKIFRVNFISLLLKLGGNRLSSIIISSYRTGEIINTTEKYLKVLSNCKFYLCTRAAVKEDYKNNLELTEGRYANRVSEAIACGCIPLYFQPQVKNIFKYYINYFLYFSKFSKMFNISKLSGNKKSKPYDEIKFESGFVVAEDPIEAVNIIKSNDAELYQKIKNEAKKIHEEYIDPVKFFEFILTR